MSILDTPTRTIDIRAVDGCSNRKAQVLEAFDGLATGERLEVVNDHLPQGLLLHFEAQRPGRFCWTLLESGPEVFRVSIQRLG